MYNIGDDNELDRISREAAGRYSPPASGSDWESLSAELDKVLPVAEEKKRRGFFFWWLLPVLLIGGGAYYWLGPENNTTDQSTVIADKKQDVLTKTDKKQDIAIHTPDAPVEANKETTIKTDVQRETALVINDKQDIDVEKAISKAKTNSSKNNQQAVKNLTVTKQFNDAESNTAISKPINQQVTVNPETAIVTPQVINKAIEPEQKNSNNQSAQEIQQPVKENKIDPAQETINQPITNEEQKKTPAVNELNFPRGKGWSYGFLVGIDKSTVKFKYGNNPGINLGMMGGYHFNDRLSVHTGAVYTQKNYKVAGEDFTAPKGSWASYYKIDNVEGYCRMWEVPVVLRYNLGRPAKKNIFLSTGLSSYFMTKENYDYYYYSSTGQLVSRHNEYKSSDTHILSIADFSVGFENRLTTNWSLLVEPYARIPLSGVGFGDIQLSSFGLNFSMQYRQPSKK